DVAEAGLLGDHRAAGGEVLHTAFAEPAAAQAHVLFLGDGAFAARPRQVAAVGVEVGGDLDGGPHLPAVLLEQLPVRVAVAAQGQLEPPAGAGGEVEDFQELRVLAPGVDLALVTYLAVELAPVADGREEVAGLARGTPPEVEEDRR